MTRLIYNTSVGILIGLLFIDLGFSQTSLRQRMSAIDFVNMVGLVGAMGAMEPVFTERVLLYREQDAYGLPVFAFNSCFRLTLMLVVSCTHLARS